MEKIKQIREFFWPILEKCEPVKEPTKDLEIKAKSDELLKAIYDYAFKRLDAEEDRIKVVENKSTIFIGTIGIITSIVIGITSTLIKEKKLDGFMILTVVLLFILTIYMLRTVWFAIKAIERKAYHSLSISDFCKQVDKQFYKNVITEINLVLQKNYPTTNSKVDNMTMAQEYFKRGIVVLGLFATVILFLFFDKYGLYEWFESKINREIDLNVSYSNVVILYIICSIQSIAILILFLKQRKINSILKQKN